MKLSELQSYIKEFDYAPEQSEHYFLKLMPQVLCFTIACQQLHLK